MTSWQNTTLLVLILLAPMTVHAQTYDLGEAPKTGESYRIAIETGLTGSLKVNQDGKETAIRINAKNDHLLLERALKTDKGVIQKSARFYEKAVSLADIGTEKVQRNLREQRRLMVAQRIDDSLLCYSPAGPLTRAELDVVSQHFDTLHLTGLLPTREMAIGDSWAISNPTAQSMCLFEGLLSHDLVGKLLEVKDGLAIVSIEGKASGVELGAMVKLEIKATAKFDLLKHRLIALEWKQKDVRELGPASPAAEMESTTVIRRTVLEEEPKELSQTALAGVPSEDDPQELLKLLEHKDHKGRYAFLHTRDWHVVGQTDHHLVLRLMERGDFIAQATITAWKKEAPGQHTSIDDFKKQIADSPNWEMEEIAEAGTIPTDEGRFIYRVTARGDLDGSKVVQNFVLLAGPQGDQAVVTFTLKPANAAKIGTRDLALVNAIEFLKK